MTNLALARKRKHNRQRRLVAAGLSMLEIIVALAVLAGSAAVLSQMVDIGSRHATRATEIAAAQTITHNVLHELLAGERVLVASNAPEPVDLWSAYDYTVDIEPVGIGRLLSITVQLFEREDLSPTDNSLDMPNNEQSANSMVSQIDRRPVFRLTRWIRRPHGLPTEDSFELPTNDPSTDLINPTFGEQ